MSYSLSQFGHMIADDVRMDAFAAAIRELVRPGDVVLDIGTGTGVFALLACQAGASKVYAVDDNPWIETGPAFAAANGMQDRIEFIRGLTTKIPVPEPVDVVIGDIRGRLPTFDLGLSVYRDARERFLKPGGRLLPVRDRLVVGPLHDPERHARALGNPWRANRFDLDLSPGYETVASTTLSVSLDPSTVLLGRETWMDLDYGSCTLSTPEDGCWFAVDHDTTVEFLVTWFEAELAPGIGFSNDPAVAARPVVYNQLLLPLAEPAPLRAGQHLRVRLRADAAAADYLLTWDTSVHDTPGGPATWSRRATNFQAVPVAAVQSRASSFVPQVGERGRATARGLDLLVAGATVGQAAERLRTEHALLLPDAAAALSFAADLSQRYAE